MKKQWILSALMAAVMCGNTVAQDDAILMTINGKDVTKSEFEYIYNKNNKQQVDIKTLDEYLPLFVNYKLKVDAAEKAGIDTTQAFIKEFDGYRRELAKPYLTDRTVEENLLKEAYTNYCKNVEISHILISFGQFPDEAAKTAALNKAKEVAARAQAGEDFATLAQQYSEDPGSQSRGGYLGYIKGGRLIYAFEKVAFSMAAGEVSDPVETRFGYHIIKVHNVRADRGERLCSHIFLVVPRGSSADVEAQKKAEAEAIYNDLMAGADFAQMAREKSNDQANSMRGGELPWCGSGDFVKEFEDAAFSLEVGEIAAPVRSSYGYHIIKLNDKRDVLPFEQVRNDLVQRIARDERSGMARQALIDRLKNEYNYKLDDVQVATAVALSGGKLDSVFVATLAEQDMTLATYADQHITATMVAKAIKSRRNPANAVVENVIKYEINRLAEEGLLNIEMNNLTAKYPEYRNLLNEYRDGMLLFEISNREVWEKAAVDTKGLEKFFKKNKKSYAWDRVHYKGFVVSCANDTIAKEVQKLIKKTKADDVVVAANEAFNNDSTTNVSIERGIYIQGDNKYVDELVFEGAKAERKQDLPVVFVSGKKLKAPESYQDVKGKVTADYQEYLEKVWVENLNKRATVVKNEDVLKTINK